MDSTIIKQERMTIKEDGLLMPGASSKDEVLASSQAAAVESSTIGASRSTVVLKPTAGTSRNKAGSSFHLGNHCRGTRRGETSDSALTLKPLMLRSPKEQGSTRMSAIGNQGESGGPLDSCSRANIRRPSIF